MKNLILSAIAMAFVLGSCNQKKEIVTEDTGVVEKDTIVVETSKSDEAKMYACSMHPEVTGKMGDKCSKCNMELTEPLSE